MDLLHSEKQTMIVLSLEWPRNIHIFLTSSVSLGLFNLYYCNEFKFAYVLEQKSIISQMHMCSMI